WIRSKSRSVALPADAPCRAGAGGARSGPSSATIDGAVRPDSSDFPAACAVGLRTAGVLVLRGVAGPPPSRPASPACGAGKAKDGGPATEVVRAFGGAVSSATTSVGDPTTLRAVAAAR